MPATPTQTLADALSTLPDAIRPELARLLSQGSTIPSSTVQSWLDGLGIEIGTLMIRLLPVAAAYARPPISQFTVGAVALGVPPPPPIIGPGSLYLGSNQEFVGESLTTCVHAEQSATNNAWLSGQTGVQAIAINAAPCGYCRQFLYELRSGANGFDILLKANADPNDYQYTMNPLTYFLPDPFGPQDLQTPPIVYFMDPQSQGLTISSTDPLAVAALGAANMSYAPYSKAYAGVAIQVAGAGILIGSYAENAAYNPSLSPLESALAFANMSLAPQAATSITAATLVEAAGPVSQLDVTRSVLASVAPGVQLTYVRAS